MRFASEETTNRLRELFSEAKHYYALEKHYLSLQGAEILTILLSRAAIWAIIIMLAALFFLFGCLTLAFWFSSLLGSNIAGFGIVTGATLLGILLLILRRKAWIEEPIARFMVQLLVEKHDDPDLAAELDAMEKGGDE